MTAAQLRTLTRSFINEEDTSRLSDTVLDYHLQSALEAFNRRVGYKFADDTSTITIVNGTQEYALPATVQEIWWAEWNSTMLDKGDIREWRSKSDTAAWRNQSGSPEEYAVYGRKFVLRPKPNAAAVTLDSTVTIRYIASAGAFADAELAFIPDEDHRILGYYAAAEWFETAKSAQPQFSQLWMARFTSETQFVAGQYSRRQLEL